MFETTLQGEVKSASFWRAGRKVDDAIPFLVSNKIYKTKLPELRQLISPNRKSVVFHRDAEGVPEKPYQKAEKRSV